jgi:hypothetical protein
MLELIAKKIHDEVYRYFTDFKTAVFLCGAGSNVKGSVREKISKELSAGINSYYFDVFYPEDLFEEILFGPNHQDLLSLESILADSVDSIVLIIESYGAVAELGAFASNNNLRKKLVCITDFKYRRKKSFINYGPLRLLKDKGEGVVVFTDFENIADGMKRVKSAIRKTKKLRSKTTGVTNVLNAHHYILPSIYLFEPVKRDILVELVRHASGTNEQKSFALTAGALSMLNKKGEVTLTPEGYSLTRAGMLNFSKLGSRGRNQHPIYDSTEMDTMRVAILNWRYRGKKLEL